MSPEPAPASRCPVCRASLEPSVLESKGDSRLYACRVCDLQVWQPRVNPGPSWYDEEAHYLAKSIVDWLGWYHSYGMTAIPNDARTLLDVGCADGRFVYRAAGRGIDAIGIDFSPRLVAAGNARYGGERLRCLTLERYLEGSPPPVDVVTLFEVIEHVEEPLDLLQLAVAAARPGGTVIVSTPNRLGRPHPPRDYDSPPHHLTRWSPHALVEAASRAGLRDARIAICPPRIALKALLLDTIRFGLVTAILRRQNQRAAAAASSAASDRGIRALMKAKDLAAGALAAALSPLVGRSFPGPSMVLTARTREVR